MTIIPLPPFVDAGYLELTLNWPRSHHRRFSEKMRKDGGAQFEGLFADSAAFYEDLSKLLGSLGGYTAYDQSLRSFDQSATKRGLIGKIVAKIRSLGDVPCSSHEAIDEFISENIENLVAAGYNEIAAEYAWASMLIWANVSKKDWSDTPQNILAAIELRSDELFPHLGEFLTYLSRDFDVDLIEAQVKLDLPTSPPGEILIDAIQLQDRWSQTRTQLVDLLEYQTTADESVAGQVVVLALQLREIAVSLGSLRVDEASLRLRGEFADGIENLAGKTDDVSGCKFDTDQFFACLDWDQVDLGLFSDEEMTLGIGIIDTLEAAIDEAVTARVARQNALTAVQADEPGALETLNYSDQVWREAKSKYAQAISALWEFHKSALNLEAQTAEPNSLSDVEAAHADVRNNGSVEGIFVAAVDEGEPKGAPEVQETLSRHIETDDADIAEKVAKAGGHLAPDQFDAPSLLVSSPIAADSDNFKRLAEAKLQALLVARKFSLAREVSSACAEALPGHVVVAPTVVFEALAIGEAVRGVSSLPASNAYDNLQGPLFEVLQKDAETEEAVATQLLGFASALRPALFSPHGSAGAIVQWGAWHDALYNLGQFAGELTNRLGRPLTVADLAPWQNKQSRVEEAARTTGSLLAWAETAPKQTLKFARATQIWGNLFKSGPLAVAIDRIRAGHSDALQAARTAAEWLSDDSLLKRLDDENRETSRDKPLEAGARLRLLAKMADAAGQLESWADVQIAASGTERNQHIALQTDELRRHLETAATKIKSAKAENPNVVAALTVVAGTIDELLQTLDGKTFDEPLTLEQQLYDEPLLAVHVPYRYGQNYQWTDETAHLFIDDLDPHALPSFAFAFDALLASRRFESAGHLIVRATNDEAELEEKRAQLRHSFELAKADLQTQFERLRRQVDVLLGADTSSQIDPSLSNRLDTLLGSISANAGFPNEPRDLFEYFAQVESLSSEIETAFAILIDPLRTEIAMLEAEGNDVSQLKSMADRRDLATLSEHLEAAKDGHIPSQASLSDGVLSQYANAMLSSGEAIEGNLVEFRRALDQADEWGQFNFGAMDKDERAGARRLLAAWTGLRTDVYEDLSGDQARRSALINLFQEMGFTNVRISQSSSSGIAKTYSIRTDPLGNREFCVVPSFGSESKGVYNVVVVDPKKLPQGEDLFSVLQRASVPGSANFLVVLGTLPRARRNQFMQAARRDTSGLATALLDESVIVFLAARPGRRLSYVFDLTIPQGAAQPYSDKAAQTSVEMFFGRQQELNQLLNPNGSCLVYGGRQLGKTALLKQLKLQNHKPPHQYVLYGSYEEYGDGARYPTDDFWKRIGDSMVEAELATGKLVSRAQVEERILDFLNRNPLSRIIILIDEADKILKSEIQTGYRNIAPIKARLMEPTNYRCKFVFAGLHDVQRSARSPNSPLLHFGKAIQVGPLYQSDIRAAWEMVERPMGAVGYVFPDHALIGRILSQVGYYPSFVQSFCKGLIERLDKRTGRMGVKAVPIGITGEDVDEATRDEDFRRGLQDKFEATLNLDERYRLITYVLLVEGFRDRELGILTSGYMDVEVQKLALSWWPEGFADDLSLDAFQGLLEEMVGLGVLVKQPTGRYMIRSARIAAMLGGIDQISQKIVELVEKPRAHALDAGNIRRLSKDDERVSPLTERQESMLIGNPNPVHVAVGSAALGLDWLAPHLERLSDHLPDDEKFQTFKKNYTNPRDLLKCVEAAASDAQRGGSRRHLAWVLATGPWPDAETLHRLADHPSIIAARKSKPNGVRVILVPTAIDWKSDSVSISEGTLHGAAILPMSPMGEGGLQHWLASMTSPNASVTNQDAETLKRLTGGFPRYLWELKRSPKSSDILDAATKARDKRIVDRRTLAEIGLDHVDLVRAAEEAHNLGGIDLEMLSGMGFRDAQAILLHLQRMGVLEITRTKTDDVELALNPFVNDLVASFRRVEA